MNDLSTELRHGYTLADVERMARIANRRVWSTAIDYSDRHDAAWHGVVEALYSAEHWIPEHTLVIAGQRAVLAEVSGTLRHHGINEGQFRPAFVTYWADWLWRTTPSCEDSMVDRIALGQVLPLLPPRARETLLAVAAHGSFAAAKEAAQINGSHLTFARRRFAALWFDHESPPPRTDRYPSGHHKTRPVQPCGTPAAYKRHLAHGEHPCEDCRQGYSNHRRSA